MPDFDDECFFITPIGEEGSAARDRANGVLELIVAPAAQEAGLEAVRADQIGQPGQITPQVLDHVLKAKAAVADLTGANPNVYYELGVRHAARLPVVLISEDRPLPFDIAQQRTIFFDRQNLGSIPEARRHVATQLLTALSDPSAVDSPVSIAVDLSRLAEGTPVERTLAEVLAAIQELDRNLSNVTTELAFAVALSRGPAPAPPSPLLSSLLAEQQKEGRYQAAINTLKRSLLESQRTTHAEEDEPAPGKPEDQESP